MIERGALYVDAGTGAPGDSRLAIETPAGILLHVGTQYEVRLDGSDVRVRVREGRVEWQSKSGAVERGDAGEQFTIAADGAVSARSRRAMARPGIGSPPPRLPSTSRPTPR